MALAGQTGLIELLEKKVHIAEPKIASGSANPASKPATAGICAGRQVLRNGLSLLFTTISTWPTP